MFLWSWGANSHGQLGQNLVNEQLDKPTKIDCTDLFQSISEIVCGGGHSLLLDGEGKLFSCGWNHRKQLGDEQEAHQFHRVWPLSGINFYKIACGWDFSCAVSDDQFLFVWGSNSHGQLGLPKSHFKESMKPIRLQVNAKSVSMGLRHTAIVNSKGEVWITGCGKYGQLGLGEEILSADRFEKVSKVGKISHIACGQNHTLAWSSEEYALYVWGDNKHGQLLLSPEKYKKIFDPQKIDIDVRQDVKKLLSGWTNALLWLGNGKILTWGRNNYGQLGTSKEANFGKLVNVSLPDDRQIKDIAIGSEHTICLAADNTLWAWGWNEHANTGTGSGDAVFHPTLVPIDTGDNSLIMRVYAGGGHNFVVTSKPVKEEENGASDCEGKVPNEI
ncbi:ultraviolet-B receptor UVR8 [Plutella xylostella]|uniref:ultraviolet-B receptor UVR8 n=1 Tax=Plutella xylostella TaxID=51655 RepID=UPI0020331960|nr:ultraviolet-B receptor UVR8 [Plutella xylostella]